MQKSREKEMQKKTQKKICRKKMQKNTKNMLEKTQKDMIQENLDISEMVFETTYVLIVSSCNNLNTVRIHYDANLLTCQLVNAMKSKIH